MNVPNQIAMITNLHSQCLSRWDQKAITLQQQGFLRLVEQNHAFNFQLWHAEDRARRDDAGFEFVFLAKREIDSHNQQRNNQMEAMDEWLFQALSPSKSPGCPVHSETPGMMIDRLSILALKVFHMALQVIRKDVDEKHHEQCLKKLQTLNEQKQQLHDCLKILIDEIQHKTRTFRVYHQFKMYNDPTLNPALYETRKDWKPM